ncbi:hypothetical protein WA158_002753 [Blastocystis sp. Blastoise]
MEMQVSTQQSFICGNYVLEITINILWIFVLFPLYKYNTTCIIHVGDPKSCDYKINFILVLLTIVFYLFITITIFTCIVVSIPKKKQILISTDQQIDLIENENKSHYYYGIYYDPDDIRLFVPHPYKSGSTINMGIRPAQIIIGVLLLIVFYLMEFYYIYVIQEFL